jgi:hypothetical protein
MDQTVDFASFTMTGSGHKQSVHGKSVSLLDNIEEIPPDAGTGA